MTGKPRRLTDAETETLRALWRGGVRLGEIARALGTHTVFVEKLAAKLDLGAHPDDNWEPPPGTVKLVCMECQRPYAARDTLPICPTCRTPEQRAALRVPRRP